MNDRLLQELSRLADRIVQRVVVVLVRTCGVRLGLDGMKEIRAEVDKSLSDAALASRLDTLHPPPSDDRPDQSLIDTRPYPKREKK